MKAKAGKVILTAVFVILVLLMTSSVVLFMIVPNYNLNVSSLYGFATNGFPLILGLSFLVLSIILISTDRNRHLKKSIINNMSNDALYDYLIKGKNNGEVSSFESDIENILLVNFRTAAKYKYPITFCSLKNCYDSRGIDTLFPSCRINDTSVICMPFLSKETASSVTEGISCDKAFFYCSPDNPTTERDLLVFLCVQ